MKNIISRALSVTALFLAMATMVACRGESSGSSDNRYAGKVRGSNAYAYVQRDGDYINAYVANGTTDPYSATIVGWFSGDLDTATNTFHGTSDTGMTIDIAFHEHSCDGQLQTQNKTTLDFDLDQKAGFLYRTVGEISGLEYEGGFVVLEDNSQRGGVLYGRAPERFAAVSTPLFATITETVEIFHPHDPSVSVVADGYQVLSAF